MGASNNKPSYPPEFSYIDDNHFINDKNKKIFCRYWPTSESDQTPKAVVFICHGLAEHCGCYADMAEKLNEQNIYVYGHDHVGHGLSEGDRVHIESMDEYIDDIVQHTDTMKQKFPDSPFFMVGHSMGGAIALLLSHAHPDLFNGIILIGPAVKANAETVTPFKKGLARMVATLAPQYHVGKLESKWISRDKNVQKEYESDPLVYHTGLKAKWSVVMLDAMDKIQNNMDKLNVPILCIHGSEDKLCHVEGSRSLQKEAQCADKTLEIFEGGYHQVHKEPDGMKERCWSDIAEWILERLDQSPDQ